MPNEARWYVVHTYSGYENKVADSIEKIIEAKGWNELICEVRVPVTMISEIKNNKEREVESKLFPSYVFLKMVLNDDTWHAVRHTRGVKGFVGTGSKPAPLSEEEMQKFCVAGPPTELKLDYGKGDVVTITNGLLEGYEAVVESIHHDKGIAKVLVNMFGRKTSAEVEFKDLKSFSN